MYLRQQQSECCLRDVVSSSLALVESYNLLMNGNLDLIFYTNSERQREIINIM